MSECTEKREKKKQLRLQVWSKLEQSWIVLVQRGGGKDFDQFPALRERKVRLSAALRSRDRPKLIVRWFYCVVMWASSRVFFFLDKLEVWPWRVL